MIDVQTEAHLHLRGTFFNGPEIVIPVLLIWGRIRGGGGGDLSLALVFEVFLVQGGCSVAVLHLTEYRPCVISNSPFDLGKTNTISTSPIHCLFIFIRELWLFVETL